MRSDPDGATAEWELQTPESGVRFSRSVLDRLARRRSDQGLLCGEVESEEPLHIQVDSIVSVDRLRLEHPPIVGCYRRHTTAARGIDASDKELAAKCVPNGTGIYLQLYAPSGRSVPAEFYRIHDGVLDSEPLRGVATFLRSEEPAAPPAAAAARHEGRISPWVWISAALGVLVILGFADRTRTDEGPALDASPTEVAAITPLQLQIMPVDSLLQVRWSPSGEAGTPFSKGILAIEDGGQHRRVALDSDQLKNASFTYLPSSKNVHFQLEVTRRDSAVQMASARYEAPAMQPSSAGTLASSTPAPKPRPSSTVVASIPMSAPKPKPASLRPANVTQPHVTAPAVYSHDAPAESHPRADWHEEERSVADQAPVRQRAAVQEAPPTPRVEYHRDTDVRDVAEEKPAPRKGFKAKIGRIWPFKRGDKDRDSQ